MTHCARVLPAVLFALACGAVPDAAPKKTWSARHYIVARGHGADPATARANARANVSAQVHSALRSTLEVEVGERGGDAYTHARRSVVESTEFRHAELIAVEPAECADGCVAVAHLDRREVLGILSAEYARARAPFAEAAAATEAAGEDPLRFTPHFGQAAAAWRDVAGLGYQLRVVGRGDAPAFAEDDARFRGLLTRRARLMAASRVTVLRGEVDEAVAPAVQRALVDAFGRLGVPATPAEACADGLVFEPRADVRCAPGSLGPRCVLDLTGTLSSCAGGVMAEVDLRSAKVAGAHPSSEHDARRALGRRITADALVGPLGSKMAQVLPIEGPRS